MSHPFCECFVNISTLHKCGNGCWWLQCDCQLLIWTEPCGFTSHTFFQLLGPESWVTNCVHGNLDSSGFSTRMHVTGKLKRYSRSCTSSGTALWVQWKWRCNVIFELLEPDWYVPWVFYSQQGNPVFPLHRILGKPQYHSGCSGDEIDPWLTYQSFQMWINISILRHQNNWELGQHSQYGD